jgi:hypothetical protein
VAELHDSAAQAGLSVLEIPLHGVKGKQSFIAAFATAVQAGPDFGDNWDALADVLCDLKPAAATGYVLLLRDSTDSLGLSAHDREIAEDILADTVLFWRQRNKPCWVFYA